MIHTDIIENVERYKRNTNPNSDKNVDVLSELVDKIIETKERLK